MRRLPVLSLLAVVAVLSAGASARADFIPWIYTFTASPNPVTSSDGSASVTLAGTWGRESLSFNGLLAANLSAAGSSGATFSNRGYTLTMTLNDFASGSWTDLKFAGTLSGTGPFALTNKFTNPSQTVTLGQHQYTVTLGAFTPPTAGQPGKISADVVVTGPSVSPNQVPEPASLLLAALGGSAVGLRAWWRRRRDRAA
jgi:hypothetical protein